MKVFVALFALVAVASAGIVSPLGLASPLAYSAHLASPLAYSAHVATPLTYAAPWAAPLAYSAPLAIATPAVQNGYVAATRGAVHTAPLPEGPHAFSHHINTAPAPGTL